MFPEKHIWTFDYVTPHANTGIQSLLCIKYTPLSCLESKIIKVEMRAGKLQFITLVKHSLDALFPELLLDEPVIYDKDMNLR